MAIKMTLQDESKEVGIKIMAMLEHCKTCKDCGKYLTKIIIHSKVDLI